MTSTKQLVGLSVIFVSMALPWSIQAANTIEQTPRTTESMVVPGAGEIVERATVVATTEITAAEIVAHDEHGITMLFNLSNAVGVQSGVVYGVELYTAGANRRFVDSEIFSATPLTLGDKETRPVSVTYVAPDFLIGEHELWVAARTKGGMLLALAPVGTVNLTGTGEQVTLSQCVAQVGGTKYPLSAGVDIAPGETLTVDCVAENGATTVMDVTPGFTTFERSLYGEQVASREVSTVALMQLEPGEKQSVTFVIPTVETPQAYDVVVTLATNAGKIVSQSIVVHYVVQGASATIQNSVFDKAAYGAGETASVLISWSLAADAFLGARGAGSEVGPLTMSVVLADGAGVFCAAPNVLALEGTSPVSELKVPVLQACEKPQILITLADAAGTKLSAEAYEYAAVVLHEELSAPGNGASAMIPFALGSILIGSLIVMSILFIRKKRYTSVIHFYEPRNTSYDYSVSPITLKSLIVISVLGGTLFLGGMVTTVDASTLQVISGSDTITFTVNLDKATYDVNEPIRVVGAAFVTGCGNAISAGGLEADDGLGVTQSIGTFSLDPLNGIGFALFDKFITGYTSPGSKLLPVRAYVATGPVVTSSFGTMPLTVACPSGSSWDGSSCVFAGPIPTAVVSGSGCVISQGQSTCVATISWDIANATTPSVKNITTSTVYSFNVQGINESRTITQGVNVIAAYNGATSLDATTVVGTCATGSTWDGSTCAANVLPPPPPPPPPPPLPGCPFGMVWNGSACVVIVPPAANLQPAGLSISPSSTFDLVTGTYNTLFVQYSVRNNGMTNAGSFTNRVQLDRDDNGSIDETINDSISGGLAAGADTPLTPLFLASNVPFGTHRVFLTADTLNTISESDESDNEASYLLTVPVPDPQLSLTAFPTLIRSGQSTTLSWDTKVTFPMDCTVQGTQINKAFDPSVDGPTGSKVIGPLTAKAAFVLTCTEPTLGTVFTKTTQVEVLPTVEER